MSLDYQRKSCNKSIFETVTHFWRVPLRALTIKENRVTTKFVTKCYKSCYKKILTNIMAPATCAFSSS
jgi:hypothetical protein